MCMVSVRQPRPPVQGQCKLNKDKLDAATLLTRLTNVPYHLTPVLTVLLLSFCPLMFIQALIIQVSFSILPHHCWYLCLFSSSFLFSPLIFPHSSFLQSLYSPPLSFNSLSLINSPPSYPPCLCPPLFSPPQSLCHVNARYRLPFTVG